MAAAAAAAAAAPAAAALCLWLLEMHAGLSSQPSVMPDWNNWGLTLER